MDASGALHHVMIRGIEGRRIFEDDRDRDNLLNRLKHRCLGPKRLVIVERIENCGSR